MSVMLYGDSVQMSYLDELELKLHYLSSYYHHSVLVIGDEHQANFIQLSVSAAAVSVCSQ